MKTEIYLSGERYGALANDLLTALRTHRRTLTNPGMGTRHGLETALADALTAAGVDPVERHGLVDALADIEVSAFDGHFDPCDVKVTLGERGDVWPDNVREDEEERVAA